ncbi:thiol:disulfide interchange protein DsbA/DsbL [Candidatus Nitrosacidococcus tergens]|uniref:Thiol:disulfide interchange protein n=1 Tax=Candidatus Nitrosacidococcus tergens TaxID=553981 RepID=A0A7G1QBT7_9GAMM|nr:thiol:disulfide interchange protein DsbA/DsbL [Candidatus Nitrosacidococcus tergens]CAB1276880.1 Thiol:disulfide interchange protein [Candidatus Nitrosacidococcus tergens]
MLRLISQILFICSLLFTASFTLAEGNAPYTEGKNYKVINPPLSVSQTEKPEIIEFFWYGCPHCYNFDPFLEKWIKDKGESIVFDRVPAVFRDSWAPGAQDYYTMKAMGIFDKIHRALFDEIHIKKNPLNTKKAFINFLGSQGIDKEEAASTFDSFAVQGKVQQAVTMTKASGITGVPALIINGKYSIDAGLAGNFEGMLDIADYLLSKK